MLFLQHAADGSATHAPALVPVDDACAACLERALLAEDEATRVSELQSAFAINGELASWAIAAAELGSGRTINRAEDAAAWVAGQLAAELASGLVEEDNDTTADDVTQRLPQLAKRMVECERRAAEFDVQLERAKLDAMKELAYGASHEINNPLANIAARAQTLLDDEEDPARRQKLVAIHRQAMRAHEMISDLMLFARPPKLKLGKCNLAQLVGKVVEQLTPLAQENHIDLTHRLNREPAEVIGDSTQLGVAVHAVVKNAIEACHDGGYVEVELCNRTMNEQIRVEIVVRDNGPGISNEIRQHIFDPFFSGREAGRGLGFGLSKCWRIVTDHGGEVVVDRRPIGEGAQISILLPPPASHPNTAVASR
jgi:signal transduction histidine kinase